MASLDTGNQAEYLALKHLQLNKLQLVERNYHCRRGEIDLIMLDQTVLVFIEVRYRKSARFGSALESVDQRKQNKIIHTANHYLQQQAPTHTGCRFDVVAINSVLSSNDITWVKDAFQLN